MELRENEQVLKIFRHHPTPFIFQIVKTILAFFPFFFLVVLLREAFSTKWFLLTHLMLFLLFTLVVVYLALIYWLDQLVVTNQRVIHIDWKYLTVRDEAEALLDDIMDVQTEEKGILSKLRFFDYGTLRMDTSSSYVTLEFFDAPDPEGIRKFVFHVKNQ